MTASSSSRGRVSFLRVRSLWSASISSASNRVFARAASSGGSARRGRRRSRSRAEAVRRSRAVGPAEGRAPEHRVAVVPGASLVERGLSPRAAAASVHSGVLSPPAVPPRCLENPVPSGQGEPFFASRRPRARVGVPGRRLGVSSLVIGVGAVRDLVFGVQGVHDQREEARRPLGSSAGEEALADIGAHALAHALRGYCPSLVGGRLRPRR